MEYVRALSVHFAALLLLFSAAMALIAAFFGDLSFESERSFTSVVSEIRGRRLNALLGSLCVLAGGGLLLLAVCEFRPRHTRSYCAALRAGLASWRWRSS